MELDFGLYLECISFFARVCSTGDFQDEIVLNYRMIISSDG